MAYYRLYFREDGPTGPISGVEEINAADDMAAAAEASAFAGVPAMELWCGTRLVRAYALEAAATG